MMSNSEYPGDLILEMLLVNLFFIFIALVYVLIHFECLMQCFCTVLHCSRHFFHRKIGRDLLKMFWDNVLNIKSTNGRVILTEKINTSLFKF